MRLPLDHVGILGPDIDALVAEFRELGFRVVGPEELTAVDADGRPQSLGQHSAHVMFADCYIELTAVTRPTAEHHLSAWLRPPWGLRLLILDSKDIAASHAQAAADGLAPGPIQHAEREIRYGDPGTARFRWFALPSQGGGEALIACAGHDTRERVYQPTASGHANGAVGISTLYARNDDMLAALSPLAASAGIELRTLGDRGGASSTPALAGLRVVVRDPGEVRQHLARRGIVTASVSDGIALALRCGVVLVFGEAPA